MPELSTFPATEQMLINIINPDASFSTSLPPEDPLFLNLPNLVGGCHWPVRDIGAQSPIQRCIPECCRAWRAWR